MDAGKLQQQIQQIRSDVVSTIVELPAGKNLNHLLLEGDTKGIYKLLHAEQPVLKTKQVTTETTSYTLPDDFRPASTEDQPIETDPRFTVHGEHRITMEATEAHYHVLGRLPADMSNLRVMLSIESRITKKKHRHKIDLYEYAQLEELLRKLSEEEGYDQTQMESDLMTLTDFLEEHREKEYLNYTSKGVPKVLHNPQMEREAIHLLQCGKLLTEIDSLIAQSEW